MRHSDGKGVFDPNGTPYQDLGHLFVDDGEMLCKWLILRCGHVSPVTLRPSLRAKFLYGAVGLPCDECA